MPTITSIGSAAARGFGFGTTRNPVPNIGPFILKLPSTALGAAVFDDGSITTGVAASTKIQTTVFGPLTHTSSASNLFSIGTNGDGVNFPAPTASVATLGEVSGYIRQNSSQTVSIAKTSVTNFGSGGASYVASWYDSASGDVYLVSNLYATSGGNTQPVMRKMDSSGVVQWGKAYGLSLGPSGNSIYPIGITGNSSYIYLTIADYTDSQYRPRIIQISKSTGAITNAYVWSYKNAFYFSSVITAPTTDSAGNLYFAVQSGVDVSPDTIGITLFKYSPSMSSILAAVTVHGTGFAYDGYGGGCAVNAVNGDVYWVFSYNTGATYLATNSSLVPQLARSIDDGGGSRNIASVNSVGNIYSFTKGPLVFALPVNGSKTGVYTVGSTTVTYATLSLPTYATSSRSMDSSTYYDYTTAITNTTASPTSSTGVSIDYVNL